MSLPDEYVGERRFALASRELEDAYAAAWDEFESAGEQAVWDVPLADRLGDLQL